ncbi:uncharacterized protein LOC134022965 [Osmerus eperlanus]|uniref:uncharacterized protein LOC134022965 n=1 Tax=Osmerus eperlanus TaxID=29151 RepID=UPI002E0DBC04
MAALTEDTSSNDNTHTDSQAQTTVNADLYEKIAESEKRVLMAIQRMQADIANSMERLVQAIQNNNPGPGAFMTIQPHEAIERPCRTVQELSVLQLKLEGFQQQQIMTKFLKLTGGSSIGDAVRRILRKVATNETWSNYSLKGRKGKLPFMGTTLYKIVLLPKGERKGDRGVDRRYPQACTSLCHGGPNNCTRRRIWGTRRRIWGTRRRGK